MSAELSSGHPSGPVEGSMPMPQASMEHPPSPMGPAMVSIQDGQAPTSPPSDHRHHMRGSEAMGYRPPPPGGFGPPPGYPHYPGYAPPPHSPYGAPHHHYSRGPPGSYPPPHHSPSYGYGYPPGPRHPYPYGSYDGAYPPQHSRQAAPYRNEAHPRQGPPPPLQASQAQRHSSPQKSSPTGKASPTRSPEAALCSPKVPDHVEVERLRAAAATELTHEEVKPIRSDYHFFVLENADKHRKLAEDEVRKSTDGDELDRFLVNSNLNTRLMKAWEELSKEDRDTYMVKEEEDRRRFMEEDEIASRHCATLTARGKSPKSSEKGKKEERQESETEPAISPDRESPSRKEGTKPDSVEGEKRGEEASTVEPNESETVEVESSKKRLSIPSTSPVPEETHESPTKRGRVVEGTSA